MLRLWQEALEKLGFYSGEEDMEFSSFSSGTERAVKTWQVSCNFFFYIVAIDKSFLIIIWDSDTKDKSIVFLWIAD